MIFESSSFHSLLLLKPKIRLKNFFVVRACVKNFPLLFSSLTPNSLFVKEEEEQKQKLFCGMLLRRSKRSSSYYLLRRIALAAKGEQSRCGIVGRSSSFSCSRFLTTGGIDDGEDDHDELQHHHHRL